MDNWDPRPVFVTGSTSPRTPGSTGTASRSSRRSTTSSAGRPSCTAPPCTGCGPRTSARSSTSTGSPRPGRCPTTTSSRGTRRPSGCTRCTATAARTRPRATAAGLPLARRSPTSPGSSRSPTAGQGRLPPVPRAVRDHAGRGATGRQHLHPLHLVRRLPCLVHAKADAEVIAVRPLLGRPNVTLLTGAEVTRLETDAPGRTVTGVVVSRDGEREVYRGDIVVVSAGRGQQRQDPAQLGQRQAPHGWPTGRTRWAATTCSTTARPSWRWPRSPTTRSSRRRWGSTTSTSPPRTTVPDGQHPDDRQVQRRGHARRKAQAHHGSPPSGPCPTWPSTRWTSGSPPRTCRCRRTGSPPTPTATSTWPTADQRRGGRPAVRAS